MPGRRAIARASPDAKRKLEPFLPIFHQILIDDRLALKKQRQTAETIYGRPL